MALTTVPASLSATALTLTTAAQPNITSVGTLTGLTVSGNIAGTLTTAAQTNITSLGTLSALTISGDLTVDTNTLKVDSSNNRVGIGNASPAQSLHVGSSSAGTTSNGIRIQQNEGAFDLRVDGGEFYLYDVTDSRIPFLIDTSGNVGIGTGSPAKRLHIFDSTQTNQSVRFGNPAAAPYGEINFNSTGFEHLYIDSHGTTTGYGNIVFRTGATPDARMFIHADGKVGIGTSAPSALAHVYNGTLQVGSKTGDTSIQQNANAIRIAAVPNSSTEWGGLQWYREFSDVIGAEIIAARATSTETDTDLIFKTSTNSSNAVEAMRIEHSGGLKIGTGSYTNTQYYAKDVVINAANEGGLTIANSANSHAAYIMFSDGVSSGNEQYAGYIEYNHSADRMRVKSNGTFQIYAAGFGQDAFLVRNNGNISLHGPSNDDIGSNSGIVFTANNQIRVGGNDGTNMYTGYQLMLDRMNTPGDGPQVVLSRNGYFKAAIGGLQGGSGNATSAEGSLAFYTATSSAFNERMRIDSAGTMTIKGSSNNGNLILGGNATYYGSIGWDYQNSRLNFATNGAGDMQFLTGNASRIAVFRSNGCTAFGSGATATNASAAISIFGNNVNHPSDASFYVDSGGSNDWSQIVYMGADYGLMIRAGSSHSYAFYISDSSNGAARFRINGTGVIYSSNTTVQSISDRRLKENIVDANSQWNDIKALKWRNYSWKDNLHGEGTYLGLIADEVKSISPNLVDIDVQSKEDIEAGVEDPQYETVKYSIVWMKAMKALQEAMERIETLEAEVKALKGE